MNSIRSIWRRVLSLWCKVKLWMGKRFSGSLLEQVGASLLIFGVVAVIAGAIVYEKDEYGLKRVVSDMLSPVSIRSNAYPASEVVVSSDGQSSPLTVRKGTIGFSRPLIMYLIGTIFVTGLVIATITSIIRSLGDRYRNGTMKYTWNNHVLFIGYDELMIGTLRQTLNQAKGRGNVVVSVPENVARVREQIERRLFSDQIKRLEVIQTNPCDMKSLKRKSSVLWASRIYIIGNADDATHDSQNLETMGLICQLGIEKKLPTTLMPPCEMYVRNQASFSLLQRNGLDSANQLNETLRVGCVWTKEDKDKAEAFLKRKCTIFNFHCVAAQNLLSTVSSGKSALRVDYHNKERNIYMRDGVRPHLVIVGMTEMGLALAREVAMIAHFPEAKRLTVTLVDENARREMQYFTGRAKEFFKQCIYSFRDFEGSLQPVQSTPPDGIVKDIEFEFIQSGVANPRLMDYLVECAESQEQLLSLAICTNESPKNMATALYLPRQLFEDADGQATDIPIWIYQQGDASLKHFFFEESGDRHQYYRSLNTFSLYDISLEDREKDVRYRWCKSIAAYYSYAYNSSSDRPLSRELIFDNWTLQPSSNRWSSLYTVLSLPLRLRSIGLELKEVSDGVALYDIQTEKEADAECIAHMDMDALDRLEHNRWNVEKLLLGFAPTNEDKHQEVIDELLALCNKYKVDPNVPDVQCRRFSRQIDGERSLFGNLKKNHWIHDDIRPFDDLTPYTRDKDRFIHEKIIELITQNS